MKEKIIQIIPWGDNIVMLSNLGRIAKLVETTNEQHNRLEFEWRLLKEIDFNNLI